MARLRDLTRQLQRGECLEHRPSNPRGHTLSLLLEQQKTRQPVRHLTVSTTAELLAEGEALWAMLEGRERKKRELLAVGERLMLQIDMKRVARARDRARRYRS
jgi:hypothetical protein